MDFPSIVSSTSDLAFYPQITHDEADLDLANNTTWLDHDDTTNGDRRPTRGLVHLAIVSAFILPVTLLPYLLARSRLASLKQQLGGTQTSVRVLEQELNLAWGELASGKDEVRQLRQLVQEVTQDRAAQRIFSARSEAESSKFRIEVKAELQTLIKEAQNTRTHAATLCALGTSLADIAAFMHEIEVETGMPSQGKDQRGIDRLRSLALQIQNTTRYDNKESKP